MLTRTRAGPYDPQRFTASLLTAGPEVRHVPRRNKMEWQDIVGDLAPTPGLAT
jgi:hypothetical protein